MIVIDRLRISISLLIKIEASFPYYQIELMRTWILLAFTLFLANSRYLLDISTAPDQSKVIVELYFESLCPYCQKFIANQLSSLITYSELWNIVDLRLFPFGNAKQNKWEKDFFFSCQHQEDECEGNMIMNCAIDNYDMKTQVLPFVVCLEKSEDSWEVDGKRCATQNNISWEKIHACAESYDGKESMFKVGLMTQYSGVNGVPYVIINGQQSDDSIGDLVGEVCKAFKGTQKPKICSK